jgi:Fe-S cluster assembly scaffold protein SufB
MENSRKHVFINEKEINLDLEPSNCEDVELHEIIIVQSEGSCPATINLNPKKDSLSRVSIKIFAENNASVDCVCTLKIAKDASGVDTDMQIRSWPFDKSRIKARPEMFIKNSDVKAAHGNALGTLNADDLYYLHSKGITNYKELVKRSLFNEE